MGYTDVLLFRFFSTIRKMAEIVLAAFYLEAPALCNLGIGGGWGEGFVDRLKAVLCNCGMSYQQKVGPYLSSYGMCFEHK